MSISRRIKLVFTRLYVTYIRKRPAPAYARRSTVRRNRYGYPQI